MFLADLWIVNRQASTLVEQVAANVNRSGFTGVVGVFLKRKSPNCDLLIGHRVEHGLDDASRETMFLIIVHRDDLFPIRGDFG